MKLVVTILGLLNGGYMLADGVYVLLKGKYMGPDRPGPWASLFRQVGIDVFKLGPLFISFGLLWLIWLVSLWTKQAWAFPMGMAMSVLTLGYLPVGTFISVMVLAIL
jgi:hypothetical protein